MNVAGKFLTRIVDWLWRAIRASAAYCSKTDNIAGSIIVNFTTAIFVVLLTTYLATQTETGRDAIGDAAIAVDKALNEGSGRRMIPDAHPNATITGVADREERAAEGPSELTFYSQQPDGNFEIKIPEDVFEIYTFAQNDGPVVEGSTTRLGLDTPYEFRIQFPKYVDIIKSMKNKKMIITAHTRQDGWVQNQIRINGSPLMQTASYNDPFNVKWPDGRLRVYSGALVPVDDLEFTHHPLASVN